jgi:hypothetical protein
MTRPPQEESMELLTFSRRGRRPALIPVWPFLQTEAGVSSHLVGQPNNSYGRRSDAVDDR